MRIHPEGNPHTFVGPEVPITGPKIVQGKGAIQQKSTKVHPELQALVSTPTGTDPKSIEKTRVTVKTGETGGTEKEYTELTNQIKEIARQAHERNLDLLLDGEPGEYDKFLKQEEERFVQQFKAPSETKINEKNKDGTTPLMVAVQERLTGVVQALVDAGANVNLKNKEDISTLQLAQLMQNTENAEHRAESQQIANILFRAGATESGKAAAPLPTEAEEVSVFKRVLGPTKETKAKDTGGYNSLGR